VQTESYALVTGASTGLGRELARLLAADGHPLVLVARNKTRLEEVAHELQSAHSIDIRVMPQDLSASGAARQIFDATAAQGI
jgi:hypothetical protein